MLSSAPSAPPARSTGAGAGAYEMLLGALMRGELIPASRLREAELAERFGISRTPVREALKRLESQGLVTHEPHHGAVVARLDYSAMVELYHMREVLEGTAAFLAATHATAIELEALQDMVEADRALLGLGDSTQLAHSNRLFHRQIHYAARNRFLDLMLDNMRLSLVLLGRTTLSLPERGAAAVEEHAAIVAAIAARDPVAAEAAARQHIRNAFRARLDLENRAPEPG